MGSADVEDGLKPGTTAALGIRKTRRQPQRGVTPTSTPSPGNPGAEPGDLTGATNPPNNEADEHEAPRLEAHRRERRHGCIANHRGRERHLPRPPHPPPQRVLRRRLLRPAANHLRSHSTGRVTLALDPTRHPRPRPGPRPARHQRPDRAGSPQRCRQPCDQVALSVGGSLTGDKRAVRRPSTARADRRSAIAHTWRRPATWARRRQRPRRRHTVRNLRRLGRTGDYSTTGADGR